MALLNLSRLPAPDPLRLQASTGLTFPQPEPMSRAEIQAVLDQGVPVPRRIQDGPTCGLYGLGKVLDKFHVDDARNANPLVQRSDLHRPGAAAVPTSGDVFLLDLARAKGFTRQGEMFHAEDLAALAQRVGYEADVLPLTHENIQASLSRGHPPLVAFDVDRRGNPGAFLGRRAHWAVLQGQTEGGGEPVVVATHAWEGADYPWLTSSLVASSDQMHVSDFPGAPRNIHQTLANKLVEVWPPDERPSLLPGAASQGV